MKLLYKTLFILIAVLSISCEQPTSGSSSNNSLESTLNDSNLSDGITGNVDEYFYDLDESEVPNVNSRFYRYSGLSIIEPLAFDSENDTLNFITVGDYVLSFSPNEFIGDMLILEPFDETISVTTGEPCVNIDDDFDDDPLTVDCPDINDDGQISGPEYLDLYRFEEMTFSHSYADVIKLEWDEDNERYMVVSVAGESSPLSFKYIIGAPDGLYENGRYDEGEDFSDDNENGQWDEDEEYTDLFGPDMNDDYDSLSYITQINHNDLNGFYFSDDDENGYWDEGEEWNLPDSVSYQYYFDSSQLSSVDSVYSSENLEITHDFVFNKKLISTDSLMFKISTDCNDNGQWDDAETEDAGNNIWDPAEPFLNQGGDQDSVYTVGEPFLDRNCNGQWDDAEEYIDENENDQWDEGETFTDVGNGILDEAEVCADESEATDCSPENLYSMSDRPNVLIASYTDNDWVVFENIDEETVVTPRWSDTSYQLIQPYEQLETKSKITSMVDKVETIYSYQIIENTFEEGKDYTISKVIWDELGNGDRSVAYHLYRKDDQSGDIVELIHDSYFILPTTTPGSSIDGGSFEDYLVFDNLPSEQTYLYTYNGLLRDGEKHQTSRIAYSPQTNAQYHIVETYEVASDTLTIPQLNGSYDSGGQFEEEYIDENENGQWDEGEEYTDEFTLLTDAFKITRTKNSIMQGSGLELVELNNVWLARSYGIVKDEMEFRFNEPDDFDGFYRLELINCGHCNQETFGRSSIFSGSTEVDFNQLQNVDQFNDSYNKARSFGLQKLDFNPQP